MAVAVEEATEVKAEPEVQDVVETPVLTLGESIQLYFHMQHQARDLAQEIEVLRNQILEAMREQHVDTVQQGDYKLVRQVRHYRPRLDLEAARQLLQRFHRLKDAMVETMDEAKTHQALEDLGARGLISPEEIPYEETPTREVLIVRQMESEE